jgi:hypothetical protein
MESIHYDGSWCRTVICFQKLMAPREPKKAEDIPIWDIIPKDLNLIQIFF